MACRNLLLFGIYMTLWLSECQNQAALHSITRNANISLVNFTRELETVAILNGNVGLTQCSHFCAESTNCYSAVVNSQLNRCHKLSYKPEVSQTLLTSTEYIYLADECKDVLFNNMSCCEFGRTQCLATNTHIYEDCQDAFDNGETQSGEVYHLQPPSSNRKIKAVCIFENNRGWTLMQRRLDGSVDFYRAFEDYKKGFGWLNGEYWIGLENIFYLTKRNQMLSVHMEDHDGEWRSANYSQFVVGNESANYVVEISGYSGDAGDALAIMIGMGFSTYDQDNDLYGGSCSITYHGALWYNNCGQANPNGMYYLGNNGTEVLKGVYWYWWKGFEYSLKTFYMLLGR